MQKQAEISGIYPPMPTPIDGDERVHEGDLRRLVSYLIEHGVHGLFALGTCGEFASLSSVEKKRAMEIIHDEAKGRVPVVVGVSEVGTKATIENIHTATKVGVDAVVVTTPYYYPVSQADILQHIKLIVSESDLPVMLYTIPQTTKSIIEVSHLAELAKNPRIIGIKDSSSNFIYFQNILEQCGEGDFKILQGFDHLLGSSVLLGAHGGVPGSGNIAPELLVNLFDAAVKKDGDSIPGLQRRVNQICHLFALSSVQGVLKSALKIMGVIENDYVTQPLPTPNAEAKEIIRTCLGKQGLLI